MDYRCYYCGDNITNLIISLKTLKGDWCSLSCALAFLYQNYDRNSKEFSIIYHEIQVENLNSGS